MSEPVPGLREEGSRAEPEAVEAAPPGGDRGAGARALIGQLCGLGLIASLAWLQAGADLWRLLSQPDFLLWAVLLAWPASQVLVGLTAWRLGASRPLTPLLVGLTPLVLAFALAAMSTGNLAFLGGLDNPCASFLSVHQSAEMLRLAGLLASAACWIGCLPLLLWRRAAAAPPVPTWLWPAAGALLIAVLVWTFSDPLLPAHSAVGGFAVRGLWALAGAVPALILWVGSLRRSDSAVGAERGLALWTAIWAGWLLGACGIWLLHRDDALLRLSYPVPGAPLVWPEWFEAGLVLGTSLLRLAPLAVVCLIGSLFVHRLPAGRGRRRALGLAAALAALAVLGLAHERGFIDGFRAVCLAEPSPAAAESESCMRERRVFGVCLSSSLDPR